ncbi:MAG: hypothetical protein R2822_18565 [Spirosomataceae bacterium]
MIDSHTVNTIETVEEVWEKDLYSEIPVADELSHISFSPSDPHLDNLLNEQDWEI